MCAVDETIKPSLCDQRIKMDETMIINLPHVMKKFSHKNTKKPFQMSYRRLLSIIFIVLIVINIVSMIVTTSIYFNKIKQKEQSEKHVHQPNRTNRDAYAIAQLVTLITLIVNIFIRLFGLIAIGACGKEFAYTEFESSDRKESFIGCLSFTCGMIVLLAAYYVGIIRMVPHDLLIHCILTIIGIIFVAFSLQHTDTYSKELNSISSI